MIPKIGEYYRVKLYRYVSDIDQDAFYYQLKCIGPKSDRDYGGYPFSDKLGHTLFIQEHNIEEIK